MLRICSFPTRAILALVASLLALGAAHAADAGRPFGIHVVDEVTGRGVPLVTLETTGGVRLVTDSAGWAAFDEPGLLNKRVFFSVDAPGCAFPGNSSGLPGTLLDAKSGATAEIKVMRTDVAERMYRTTGQGIYREAAKLGIEVPLPRANLNGDVVRHGAAQAVVFRGKVFWTWREATGLADPRLLARGVGAVSDLPATGGLDPSLGVHFDYIGAKPGGAAGDLFSTAEPGAIRLDGLVTAKDADGKEHLLAHYARHGADGMRLEHGIAEFSVTDRVFEPVTQLGEEFAWQCPRGHAVTMKTEAGEFFGFGDPFPTTRVPVIYEDVLNPSKYEALAWSADARALTWQGGQARPVTAADEKQLIEEKKLNRDDARLQTTSAGDNKPLALSAGTVRWNAHRKRWILIASGAPEGSSAPAAVWYAEAAQPDGPWRTAVRVAEGVDHSLSDACHHDFFDQEGGRLIYFEAVWSAPQSNAASTPRYEDNPLMFRLDVDDSRLERAREGR